MPTAASTAVVADDPDLTRWSITRALVRSILEHPADHPWVAQELGLFGVRLGPGREHRLHLWDPDAANGELVIHDHPFDLTSTVISGEITNTRYREDPAGVDYERHRYSVPVEDDRRTDTIRLVRSAHRHAAGETYRQAAPDLHSSAQVPGTVTVIRMAVRHVPELTVCQPPGRPWTSGRSRPADPAEVRRVAAVALERMARDDDQAAGGATS